jgi:tetratricopeptide (TPR) repeat protein
MAANYHHLGITAQYRGRLDEASDWYRKVLDISEELGDRPHMASTYHQLGTTAQDAGRLDEASDWYHKALTISEELSDRRGMALTYAQLGLLAEEKDQAPVALEWNIRCVTLFDQVPSPITGTGPTALARLTRQLGISALERSWRQATGQPLPLAVRDYITTHHNEDPQRRTMTNPAADAARSAAALLAPDLGPKLPAEIEAALSAHHHGEQRPGQYDSLAIAALATGAASLIVAVAQLAWSILNDQRAHTVKPSPEAIAREVRITLLQQDRPGQPDTDRIIEVVITEVIRLERPPGSPDL